MGNSYSRSLLYDLPPRSDCYIHNTNSLASGLCVDFPVVSSVQCKHRVCLQAKTHIPLHVLRTLCVLGEIRLLYIDDGLVSLAVPKLRLHVHYYYRGTLLQGVLCLCRTKRIFNECGDSGTLRNECA